MKQQTVNEFRDGLNLDLHPLVTPKTVLTDNINGTFITYNGNEFCLQNDRGNKWVANLTDGYTPIGIKEHNGILYIVSVNGNAAEIGTYPGIDWSIKKEVEDEFKPYYTPLGNLYATMNVPNPSIKIVLVTWNGEKFNEAWQILKSHGVPEDLAEEAIKNTINDIPNDTIYLTVDNPDECRSELLELNVFENVLKLTIPGGQQTITKQMSFNTSIFNFDINHPVTLDVQDSYDGSVNLIFVDGEHQNRIVNTGFSKLTDKTYKLIYRNSLRPTNSYTFENLDQETELIRTSNILTNIDLLGVQSGGQFKGGNYTFYIKFGDADYNQTDVVAESGIVSIFNGNDGVPSTISGTLLDERTDKMINLEVTGLNHAYSKIYIYYSREYSDTQGYRMTEWGMFNEPIDMETSSNTQSIWLTGFEQTVPINSEELNVDYHTIDWARAETQHSNMLFLGNVGQEETFELYRRLKNKTSFITAEYDQDEMEAVKSDYTGGSEYYSVSNIYNKIGYYPGELYRFGIVYILKDGSKTPVFNVPGWNFQKPILDDDGRKIGYEEIGKGVCLMPDVSVIDTEYIINDGVGNIKKEVITPIYLNFYIPSLSDEPDVIGWFIVRQKRIPNVVCEGLSIATDTISNTPMMWDGEHWVTQSFLSNDRDSSQFDKALLEYSTIQSDIKNEEGDIQTFDNWVEWKGYKYEQKYWSLLEDTDYTLPSSFTWDDTWTKETAVERAIRASIDATDSNRNYSVYLFYTSQNEHINVNEEDEYLENSLEILRSGSFSLTWYQKYAFDHLDENSMPVDVQTNEYVVGLSNITSLKDAVDLQNDDIIVLESNAVYYNQWKTQYNKFLNNGTFNRKFIQNTINFGKESNSLLSLDPYVNSLISSKLDGSKFHLELERTVTVNSKDEDLNYKNVFETNTLHTKEKLIQLDSQKEFDTKCVFVPSNTAAKVVDNYEFSNIAGNVADVSKYKAFSTPHYIPGSEIEDMIYHTSDYIKLLIQELEKSGEEIKSIYNDIYSSNKNINLLRGLFTPYIGLANNSDIPFGIYSIKHKDVLNKNDFLVRQQDNSEYYTISNYTNKHVIKVFRGDCFTNTVSMRMVRNFIDPVAPVSETIVSPDGWQTYVVDRDKYSTNDEETVRYDLVNLSDVNTVDLGYWVTFKCLSSYNLGLRANNPFNVDEMSLLGSPRSFYPLNGASTATGNKMEESSLLNDGLSATVGRKHYNLMPDVPYSKSEFANRIMFSNINVTDAFTNGYRTFQGLSYKDYDKQYGAITKLISLGQNIFVVMEHGLGLVPVNPKALMQTTTGEMIHIYGYGVLPDEMTIISQDYGSKYEHSVIRTPIGIYGMDVDAKKIWRFSDKQGFETISDMKIESYLNDCLKGTPIEIGINDIRAHYNGKKGDVMFTFYTDNEGIPESDYFDITQRAIILDLGETKTIVCHTNMNDSLIEFTNSDNISCNYINKTLNITGLTEGSGYIIINGINLTVTVKDQSEIIPEPEDTIPTLLLDHPSARLMLGQSCTLTPITNSSSDIIWTCDNLNIASVDNNGKITAGTVVGSAKVTASLANNPSVTATCSVITQSTPVSVIGVSLRPTNIYFNGINKTKKLTTIFSPWTATNQNVEWSVSVGGNCTVDQNGVVTGLRHDRTGSVIVRTEDGGYMKSCSVVIDDSIIPVTGVQFNKSFLIMHVGEQAELNYTLIPSNATVQNVVWDSMYSSVVKVENGILTAQSSGISKIDIITKDGGFVATCLVAVI